MHAYKLLQHKKSNQNSIKNWHFFLCYKNDNKFNKRKTKPNLTKPYQKQLVNILLFIYISQYRKKASIIKNIDNAK